MWPGGLRRSSVPRNKHPCSHACKRWACSCVQSRSGLVAGRVSSADLLTGSGRPPAEGSQEACASCCLCMCWLLPRSLAFGCPTHRPPHASSTETDLEVALLSQLKAPFRPRTVLRPQRTRSGPQAGSTHLGGEGSAPAPSVPAALGKGGPPRAQSPGRGRDCQASPSSVLPRMRTACPA